MSDQGPRRLKQGPDTPDELLRALNALQQGVDETARLERVGHRLGSMLEAAPPAAASTLGGSAAAVPKLPLLKLVLGGLGVLAPLFLYFQFWHEPEPAAGSMAPSPTAPAPATAPATAPAIEAAPGHGQAPAVPAPVTDEPPDQADQADHNPLDRPQSSHIKRSAKATHPTHAGAPRPQRTRSDRPSAATGSSVRAAPGGGEREPLEQGAQAAQVIGAGQDRQRDDAERTAENTVAQPSEDALAPRPRPEAKPRSLAAAETQDTQRIPSEAELLFNARKALKQDAALALKVLSEHEATYPKGRLVPEREVLTIEALRGLGRSAEADARLRRFEERYPNSIHLERLREAH